MYKTWRLVAASFAVVLLLLGCGRSIEGTAQTSGATGTKTTDTAPDQNQAQPSQDQGQTQDATLPKNVTKVEITYKPAKPNPPTIQRTITDPAQIAKLVDAINGVPRGMMGFAHCVADFGQQAQMKFYPASGAAIAVSVVPSCSHVQIGSAPVLVDSQGIAWKAVQEVMGD